MSRFSIIEADYLDPDKYAGWDEECTRCERDAAECECPVCPSCGIQGDPKCFFEDGIFGGCDRFRWFQYESELIIDRLEGTLK